MYTLEEIKEMISMLDQSSVHELEIEKEGFRVHIRKASNSMPMQTIAAAPAPIIAPAHSMPEYPHARDDRAPADIAANGGQGQSASEPAESADLHRIVSPMVGTFYHAPSPDAQPYVKRGDQVNEKTVVCILEAMKLMNEIEAEVSGEVVDILVENGQLVEYGQPLFLVRRAK